MPNMSLKKNEMPVREPCAREKNFDEVALGYTPSQAVDEANRCLNCKNRPCVSMCPVAVDIPGFIAKIREKNFDEVISRSMMYGDFERESYEKTCNLFKRS